jgi:hypothetical protein
MEEGEKLLIIEEGGELRMIPVPKLSDMGGVDKTLFKGRKPSKELEAMRNEWTEEFDKRITKK